MTLIAAVKAYLEPNTFRCYNCITEHGKRKRLQDKTDRKRKSMGCYDNTTKTFLVENVKFYTCIGNLVKPIDYLLESYVQYEKGIMPFNGGLLEQPSKIIEVFNIIAHLKNEHLAKQG